MTGITIPFMPAVLWIMAAALTVLILLIVFGYYAHWRHRAKAFTKDSEDVASLAAQKQIYTADVDQLRQWIQDHKDEIRQMESQLKEKDGLEVELKQLMEQCFAQDQKNESLRKEVGDLDNQKHFLVQTVTDLEGKRVGIEGNISDLNHQKISLEEEIQKLRKAAENLPDSIEEIKKKEEEYNKLMVELSRSELRLQELNIKKEALEQKVKEMEADKDRIQAELNPIKNEHEDLHRKVEGLRNKHADLDVIVPTLQSEQNYLEGDIANKQEEQGRIKELINGCNNELKDIKSRLKETNSEHLQATMKLDQIKSNISSEEEKVQALLVRNELLVSEISDKKKEKEVIEGEINKLKKGGKVGDSRSPDVLTAYSDLLEKQPTCLIRDKFTKKQKSVNERDFLNQLLDTLRQQNIFFSPRVIDAFHTSLKCQNINPLTVLAGVSGTGKTLLPIKYAEIMGFHSLVLPVQPRWDSPQDLFGFYNYLEKEYKATDLSRSLVRFDPYNFPSETFKMLKSEWTKDRMLMVLLDEMNLARTEYYFSEFLSKLELRRNIDNPDDQKDREGAEIEFDTGPSKDINFRIWVPENILFVGTMNEDETTQTLSDKVLDRANVLRFGKPYEKYDDFNIDMQEFKQNSYLSFEQWNSWKKKPLRNNEWRQNVIKWTVDLNNSLEKIGRPFGYRVQDAIIEYVANYPNVNSDERYRLAYADQIEQKIIPKLRGVDIDENTMQCFDQVDRIIKDLDENLSITFSKAVDESKRLGMFTWRGVTRDLG